MRRYLILLALVCAALVAACGGGKHTGQPPVLLNHTVTHTATSTTTAVPTPPTGALRCPPGDITMQCVLAHQPPPKLRSLAPGEKYGIDFGWSAVSASGAKSIGAKFAESYLSLDASKDWHPDLLRAYQAAGIKTFGVWETSAARASTQGGGSDGTQAAGAADARQALARARAVGLPSNEVIEFAIDCDCTPTSTFGYFRGVKSVIPKALEGAYGGYDQLLALHNAGLTGPSWHTYAWSGGRRLPCSWAPIYQYLNGSAFDNDLMCGSLTPAKPPNPHHYKWAPNGRHTFHARTGYFNNHWGAKPCGSTPNAKGCHVIRTRERSALIGWDSRGCRNPVRRQACRMYRAHETLLDGRVVRIAHHTPNLKSKVKKPRWGARHYKASDGHVTTLGGIHQQFAHRLSQKHHGVVAKW
jgi:hypothetical protein